MIQFHLQYLRRSWRFQRERLTQTLRGEIVKALKIGYEEDRQRGSHITLRQKFSPPDELLCRIIKKSRKAHCGQ
jgi:hypothetical protein